MSLLKQNIHFRPTCLTDWTPNPKKPLNPAEKAPLDPPKPIKVDNFCEYLQTKASKDHF